MYFTLLVTRLATFISFSLFLSVFLPTFIDVHTTLRIPFTNTLSIIVIVGRRDSAADGR
jgi:hypothetical protein